MGNAIARAREATKNTMSKGMLLRGKDFSDWLKVIVVLGFGFMAYQHLVDRVDAGAKTQATLIQQTTRIERYLSSKDVHYWQMVKQIGDPAQDPPPSQ